MRCDEIGDKLAPPVVQSPPRWKWSGPFGGRGHRAPYLGIGLCRISRSEQIGNSGGPLAPRLGYKNGPSVHSQSLSQHAFSAPMAIKSCAPPTTRHRVMRDALPDSRHDRG